MSRAQTRERGDPPRPPVTGTKRSFPLEAVFLTVVVFVAALLRATAIGRNGFNSDEAVYSGQAAALVGDSTYEQLFSIFRAHPLLLQLTVGGVFRVVGISDVAARLTVALLFGVGSVILVYILARMLFGPGVALTSAFLLGVLPYHVLVSRQVLVDNAFAFFVLLSLVFTVWFTRTGGMHALILAGLSAALAFISKETAVLLLPVLLGFIGLTGAWRRVRLTGAIFSIGIGLLVCAPFLLSRVLFSTTKSSNYISWQVSRPPNHGPDYFLGVLVEFGTVFFPVLALTGLLLMLVRSRRDANVRPGLYLVAIWLAFLFGFFQLWPTKLFFYLVAVVPALAICAAYVLVALAQACTRLPRARSTAVASIALVTFGFGGFLAFESYANVMRGPTGAAGPVRYDIEIQDFAGGREMGEWAGRETPPNAFFLTIGPSMGNILRFYGHRQSLALSVSPDPRTRNPAYLPVTNPDLMIRRLGIQYAIWDYYSADRSAFYNGRLMRYVRKYKGVVVFGAWQRDDGSIVLSRAPVPGAYPRVLVYDLYGGEPPDRPEGPGSAHPE